MPSWRAIRPPRQSLAAPVWPDFACQETRYDYLVKLRINVDLRRLKVMLSTKCRVRGAPPSDLVRIAWLDALSRSDELAGVSLATSEFM